MLQEILNIWKKLNENNVRYLTIGGLAVNIYGYTRNTEDIDILIDDTSENRKNLRKAFKATSRPKDLLDIEELKKLNDNKD